MKTNAGNLKKGEFIYYQNEIWHVQRADFYSPGKGSALMKTRIKNLMSGKNIEYAYKSNEQVDVLEVDCFEMQYLYKDAENLFFMNEQTYNQYTLAISIVGEAAKFMKEGNKYYVYLYEDKPLTIKGDTVSGAKKLAKVETGVTVMVPLFVKVGDLITINPETGEYGERVKE